MNNKFVKCAKFSLSTTNLTAGSTTSIGILNAGKTNATFKNVDFISIMGRDMWNKYNEFALVLVSINTGVNGGGFGDNTQDRILNIFISGLPFNKSTYNQTSNIRAPYALLGILPYSGAGANIIYLPRTNLLNFKKFYSINDINIFYQRALQFNGTYAISNAGSTFDSMFEFEIYGIY